MQLAPTITIRDIPPSRALNSHIGKRIEKLSRVCEDIMHCDVVVEHVQNSKHNGKLYNTRIDLTAPGSKLSATHAVNENVYISVREAFNAARRQLQTNRQQLRGEVKAHALPTLGNVTKLFLEDGFGFIESNGDEYYFSETNVREGKFQALSIGSPVRFISSMDNTGCLLYTSPSPRDS